MHDSLSIAPAQAMAEDAIWPAIATAGARALWIVLPILGATFVAALAAPLAIGGWNFSAEALMPQFSRLNPGDRPRPHVLVARRGGALQGAREGVVVGIIAWVLLKGTDAAAHGLVDGAGERRDRARRRRWPAYSLLVLVLRPRGDRRGRRAVPALAARAKSCA